MTKISKIQNIPKKVRCRKLLKTKKPIIHGSIPSESSLNAENIKKIINDMNMTEPAYMSYLEETDQEE